MLPTAYYNVKFSRYSIARLEKFEHFYFWILSYVHNPRWLLCLIINYGERALKPVSSACIEVSDGFLVSWTSVYFFFSHCFFFFSLPFNRGSMPYEFSLWPIEMLSGLYSWNFAFWFLQVSWISSNLDDWILSIWPDDGQRILVVCFLFIIRVSTLPPPPSLLQNLCGYVCVCMYVCLVVNKGSFMYVICIKP